MLPQDAFTELYFSHREKFFILAYITVSLDRSNLWIRQISLPSQNFFFFYEDGIDLVPTDLKEDRVGRYDVD